MGSGTTKRSADASKRVAPKRSSPKRSSSKSASSKSASSKSASSKSPSTKRDQIIRAAAKLFLDRGYEAVSINDIIQVAGGSKETIYANFGNKKKLFEAVVQQMCAEVTIRIDARPDGTMDQQLTRIAHSFLSKVVSPQILAFHRLMTSIGKTFPAAARLFYKTGPQRVHKLLIGWVSEQQKAGRIRDDIEAERLGILFHDMLVGDQLLARLTAAASTKQQSLQINETVQLAVTVFLKACATDGQRR